MKFPLPLIFVLASVASAAEVNFESLLPGRRAPVEVPNFSESLFSRGYNARNRGTDDDIIKSTAAKLKGMTVTGLIWSEHAESRAILAGDHIMRMGARVPKAMVTDSTIFQVKDVLRDKVLLEGEIFGLNPINPTEGVKVTVEVPFSLRDLPAL